jgi:prepilin-type processing-associated H-X9-DG protein
MIERENPYKSPVTSPEESVSPEFQKIKSVLRDVLIVFGIIAMLMALILPLIQKNNTSTPQPRECKRNLRQISMALHHYAVANHGEFPPACTVDSAGRPLHSWRTLILPYLERRDIYERIDLTKPWNHPANSAIFSVPVRTFQCPSSDTPTNRTTYLAVVTPNSFLRATESRHIGKGEGNWGSAIMVIDVDASQAVPWMSPQDADEQMVLETANPAHPDGTNVAFVDGSINVLHNASSATERRELISISREDN